MTISTWRGLLVLLGLLSLFATTRAADKNLIPTQASDSFPACGLSCDTLKQAQDSCTAGADQSAWVSCFCQSALLTQLKSSGSLCSSCTSSSDQSLLSSWYKNYCKSGGKAQTTADDKANTATATTTTTGATGTSSSDSSGKTYATTEEHKSWWSGHYQWVIMLIVIFVGFGIIAALGVWLKRRHDAKRAGLYQAGSTATSSSDVFRRSGMLSPSAGSNPAAPWAAAAATPGSAPSRGAGPGSFASSSRSHVAPRAPPLPSRSRSRLQKVPQSPGDIEIRQI
ncbi:hypothetical protein NUU61_001110 [Penicillium alfredii]|uniref:Integral membrane protein n=1 Tax=Penicillium alfredii TaxID=1506179 RepID=A0A9W9KRN3_9EURO|nr:uncharacterized protein NUU61_001110 [Penicillium alfredii]KAJ5115351.1 hypothetical protein NUU61_001110 [Penicillium alfredii]